MLTAMSSWLESVMIAFALCCLTSCRAPARAMSGALPEFASATSKRTVFPDCLSAWFMCETARRIDSAQLGVAIEPVRSMSCPRTMTEPLDDCCASAAGLHAAAHSARTKQILFILFSRLRGVGSRRGRDRDVRMARARRRRFDLRGHREGGEHGQGQDQASDANARSSTIVPVLPTEVVWIELHGFPLRRTRARDR